MTLEEATFSKELFKQIPLSLAKRLKAVLGYAADVSLLPAAFNVFLHGGFPELS